jgi:hypothetical protein
MNSTSIPKLWFDQYAPHHTEQDYEQSAARWRHLVFRLSEHLTEATEKRVDLSPALVEAVQYALGQLPVYGDEVDLKALEGFLHEEDAPSPQHKTQPTILRNYSLPDPSQHSATQ